MQQKKAQSQCFSKVMKKLFFPASVRINITFGAIKTTINKMGTKKNTAEKDQNTPTHAIHTKALCIHSLCATVSNLHFGF